MKMVLLKFKKKGGKSVNNNLVYKITNRINGKIYIGITNNFNRRMREHRNKAQSESSTKYYYHLSCAIRKYGWENFVTEIIADNLERKEAEKLEKKYIKLYNSNNVNFGYNITEGGESATIQTSVTDVQASAIINALKNSCQTMSTIAKQYGVSVSQVSRINLGELKKDSSLTYPIRSQAIQEKELLSILDDLLDDKLTIVEIANKYNRSTASIQRFNSGKTHKGFYHSYPIRRGTSSSYPIVAIELVTGKQEYFNNISEAANFVIANNLTRGGKIESIKSRINRAINKKEKIYKHLWQKDVGDS